MDPDRMQPGNDERTERRAHALTAAAPATRGLLPWLAGGLIAVLLAAGGLWLGLRPGLWVRAGEQVAVLDSSRVIVLRTPGGFLDVSTLVKVEEFGWRSARTCLWRDCGWLLGERLGTIRVPVHYGYRIPLAETWTLRREGQGYVLSVPAPAPRLPPGLEIERAEFRSERGGLLAPGAAANQRQLLQNLGPELARRAQRPDYLRMQQAAAEKTVQEFAQRWMREQMAGPPAPVAGARCRRARRVADASARRAAVRRGPGAGSQGG